MKIVLLPGLDGTGLLFDSFIQHLNSNLEVLKIAYPREGYDTYDELTEYVQKRLPAGEPFLLLGESFSGRIAYKIGQLNVPNLLGVIFVCSFLQSPMPKLKGMVSFMPSIRFLRSITPSLVLRQLCLGKNASEELIELFWRAVASVESKTLKKRIRLALSPFTVEDRLSIPTAHLLATGDILVQKHISNELAARCDQPLLFEIDGPHFILQANPKLSADIVSDMVKQLAAGNFTD